MIGALPQTLTVNGTERAIRTDFRVALLIFEAFADPDLSEQEKVYVMLSCLYESFPGDVEEAAEQAQWFLDGGDRYEEFKQHKKPVLDWKQDESMIFSAVNRTAGKEVRAEEHLHWWTFLSYFSAVGECLLSSVINIRSKQAKGKKLEKYEREFVQQNAGLVKIKPRYSSKEMNDLEAVKQLTGG